MSDSCLVGCMSEYFCPEVWKVPDYSIMAPFVKVTFAGGGDSVTVGNKSYPSRNNQAIIKSFDYGKSDGQNLDIQIFDEQGGAFTKFWNEMPKSLEQVDVKPHVIAEFGWVGSDCDAPMPMKSSPKIVAQLINIDVNFTEGKVKFIVTATDKMQHSFHARSSKSFGGDKTQQMPLKDAIIELFKTGNPQCKVEFLRKNKGGGDPEEWKFQKNLPERGPKDRWSSDNQNKLAAASEWLEPFRTENDLGIIPEYDAESHTVIFWEDWVLGCSDEPGCGPSLGTFIVNGGSCSPVLNFSPKINWPISWAKYGSGGGSGPVDHKMIRKKNDIKGCPEKEDAGPMQGLPITAQAVNAFDWKKVLEETEKSQAAHTKANALWMGAPIDAELTFVGNPDRKFCLVRQVVGKRVSIVVVNPFHLIGGGDTECPEWLAEPVCNQYLSNKTWLVLGCYHSITEGSYTTTLKVQLQRPPAT